MSSAASRLLPPEASGLGQTRKSEVGFQIFLLLLALAISYICRQYGPPDLQVLFQPLPLHSLIHLALLLAAVLAAVIVHEGGHLFAALVLHFKLMGAAFGPLRLQSLHGKRQLFLSRHHLFSASISAAPRHRRYWRQSMLIVIAAGPAATSAAALVALYLLHSGSVANPLWTAFLKFAAQVNVLIFAIGLVPNPADASVRNDARLFLTLLANGHGAEEIELSVSLTQLLLKGVRPQDYPRELMLRTAKWRGRPEGELFFAQALVRWSIDSDEWSIAETWDKRALVVSEHCDPRSRNHALASSACLDVLFRNDLETAKCKFAQVDTDSLFPKCFAHTAKAAQQLAQGRRHRASAEIIRAQYALPRGMACYELERKILANLHTLVLQQQRFEKLTRNASARG